MLVLAFSYWNSGSRKAAQMVQIVTVVNLDLREREIKKPL